MCSVVSVRPLVRSFSPSLPQLPPTARCLSPLRKSRTRDSHTRPRSLWTAVLVPVSPASPIMLPLPTPIEQKVALAVDQAVPRKRPRSAEVEIDSGGEGEMERT